MEGYSVSPSSITCYLICEKNEASSVYVRHTVQNHTPRRWHHYEQTSPSDARRMRNPPNRLRYCASGKWAYGASMKRIWYRLRKYALSWSGDSLRRVFSSPPLTYPFRQETSIWSVCPDRGRWKWPQRKASLKAHSLIACTFRA